MVDRKEDAYGDAAQEHHGCLGLVAEPQLVRLVPAVHAGQGAEHGVDDQVGPSCRHEQQGRNRYAHSDAEGGKVVVAGRFQSVERTDLFHDALHML